MAGLGPAKTRYVLAQAASTTNHMKTKHQPSLRRCPASCNHCRATPVRNPVREIPRLATTNATCGNPTRGVLCVKDLPCHAATACPTVGVPVCGDGSRNPNIEECIM
mmetsp:Transcript_93945/g.251468  ORF Transcript_93945/g.251468 Transcript_93945/m.251468 type:complete len:107 (-) Transcript_93945:3010-3330(-)